MPETAAASMPMARNDREFIFSDADYRFLSELVNQRAGITFGPQKKEMVYARLSRRLRALDLPDFAAYREFLTREEGRTEIENLVNAVTTNITSFFREAHHFDHIAQTVLPEIQAAGQRRLRFWSAGCSMGMEAYSLALTLLHELKNLADYDVRILATDIDTNVLAIGREGIFPQEQWEKIPDIFRRAVQHDETTGTIEMAEELRRMVAFKSLNLLEPWPVRGPFDAIFCRNVVIYFDKATQRTLFARFAELLKPGGWLYIGHSENLFNVSDAFEPVGRTIYRKR
jgi:chemotaxis protein methyltransferase CheR